MENFTQQENRGTVYTLDRPNLHIAVYPNQVVIKKRGFLFRWRETIIAFHDLKSVNITPSLERLSIETNDYKTFDISMGGMHNEAAAVRDAILGNISSHCIDKPGSSQVVVAQAIERQYPVSLMNFVAIDIETANANYASICQIGMAHYMNGVFIKEWKSYVNPEAVFDPKNVSIHGISERTVRGYPPIPGFADHLHEWLTGNVVVCHTHFDRVAMMRAFQRYGLIHPECIWLDSACVARRTWGKNACRSYGLHDLCYMLGYDFQHHDALEDAKASAFILLRAANETGLDLEGWLRRVEQPIGRFSPR